MQLVFIITAIRGSNDFTHTKVLRIGNTLTISLNVTLAGHVFT